MQEDHQKSEGILGQNETSNNSNSRGYWRVAQCLQVLTAVVEDQDSDPSAHVRQLTPAAEDLSHTHVNAQMHADKNK